MTGEIAIVQVAGCRKAQSWHDGVRGKARVLNIALRIAEAPSGPPIGFEKGLLGKWAR